MPDDVLTETAEEKTFFESGGQQAPTEPVETPEEKPGAAALDDAQEKPEGQEEQPDTRTVPYAALREERDRRKAEQKARHQKEQDFARLTGRLDILERLAQGSPKEEPKRIDPASDPAGAVVEHDRELAEFRQWRTQQDDQRKQQEGRQQFAQAVQAHENTFRAETADYDDAISYAAKSRDAELKALGYKDPGQRNAIIRYEAEQIASFHLTNGGNPAEAFYEYAKAKGYKKAAPKADRLDVIEKGQAAGKSLSNAGGTTAKAASLEALLSLSDDEFDEATKGDKWRKLFGA